jgi:hypothetical protein
MHSDEEVQRGFKLAEDFDPSRVSEDDTTDLRALADAVDAVRASEARVRELVAEARANERSWGEIGIALGVTRQAARERFADKIPAQARDLHTANHERGPVDPPRARRVTRVVVDGRYSYETDLELEVGDEVLLPPSGMGGQWVARVTALSSDYTGPCRRILGLVRRHIDAEQQDAALAAVPITGFRAGTTLEASASCGHQVLLHIEGVNRAGRPTHVRYSCQECGGIPHTAGLGSADAWRRMAAGLA